MRFLACLGLVAILFSAMPAMAQDAAKERTWGYAVCSRQMVCSDLMSLTPEMPQFTNIINNATNCLSQRMGFRVESGSQVFNSSRGINSGLCLTAERNDTSYMPQCCFKPTGKNDMCYLECVLKMKK